MPARDWIAPLRPPCVRVLRRSLSPGVLRLDADQQLLRSLSASARREPIVTDQLAQLDGLDFAGKTSAPPTEPPYERSVSCRRCGSDLAGRLERRYVRRPTTWPYEPQTVEIFLCPCRGGTRRRVERPAKEGAK